MESMGMLFSSIPSAGPGATTNLITLPYLPMVNSNHLSKGQRAQLSLVSKHQSGKEQSVIKEQSGKETSFW